MKTIQSTTPFSPEFVSSLHAGDFLLLSGIIYTVRDAAHKRFIECIDAGTPLPLDLKDQIVYYAGPTPAPPGALFGSCGPTTSGRMDLYTPKLIEHTGLRAMIGKGDRDAAVTAAIQKYSCIYCAAPAGCGALLARRITAARLVCYEDLGAEAVYELTVKDFPALVAIDTRGVNLYRR